MRMSGSLSTVSSFRNFVAGFGLTQPLVVDFYNHINLLYGSITEFCSPQSCPEMKATDEYVCVVVSTLSGTNKH
jgi:hypothetical protein